MKYLGKTIAGFLITLAVFSPTLFTHGATDIVNDATLSTNLQLCLSLDEASGTRADETANGNDFTDNNTVGQGVAIIQGNSADFESTNNEYLNISNANQTNLDQTGDYSIYLGGWRPESLSGNHAFWSTVNGANSNFGLRFIWNSGNEFQLQHRMSGGTQTGVWSYTPTVGVDYNIILKFSNSGTSAELIVNGSSQGTQTVRANDTTGNGGVIISGAAVDATTAWNIDGLVDEFAFWDKQLSSGEVTALAAGIPCVAQGGGGTFNMQDFIIWWGW